jgi:hypothetical protein
MTNEAATGHPIDGAVEPAESTVPPVDGVVQRKPRRQIRALPGILALAASGAGLLALIVGLVVAASRTADAGDWAAAAGIAILANLLTAGGVIIGLVAVVFRRGRRWGVAAIVLGVVANPFVLVSVFALLR